MGINVSRQQPRRGFESINLDDFDMVLAMDQSISLASMSERLRVETITAAKEIHLQVNGTVLFFSLLRCARAVKTNRLRATA
jgi:hypothetical protein